jgi:hypothetical protein
MKTCYRFSFEFFSFGGGAEEGRKEGGRADIPLFHCEYLLRTQCSDFDQLGLG